MRDVLDGDGPGARPRPLSPEVASAGGNGAGQAAAAGTPTGSGAAAAAAGTPTGSGAVAGTQGCSGADAAAAAGVPTGSATDTAAAGFAANTSRNTSAAGPAPDVAGAAKTGSDASARAARRSKAERRRRRDRVVVVCGLLLAAALALWPWVLDQLEAAGAFRTVSEVTAKAEGMSKEERETYLTQARSYNESLAGLKTELSTEQIWPYEQQLFFEQEPMMSWLEIPSLDLRVPIYHGTSEETLMIGVGHLEGTSLPVGGTTSHCVLTAHSGMRNLRMFDEIDQLEPGDLVLLHTVDQTFAYKMESSEVVWPEEVGDLSLVENQDLLTLVTCTPYGVNDHRLLVRCTRTSYTEEVAAEAASQATVTARHWGTRELAAFAAIICLVLLIVVLVVRAILRRRRAHSNSTNSATR